MVATDNSTVDIFIIEQHLSTGVLDKVEMPDAHNP
jgi:hypothetical protein